MVAVHDCDNGARFLLMIRRFGFINSLVCLGQWDQYVFMPRELKVWGNGSGTLKGS